ncbi:hypothetical protein SynA1528_01966 [Synechococcus sp. A15-28]|nr:hypothetical protein SynA1528_01966 [Synechococcus sp. A15-28]
MVEITSVAPGLKRSFAALFQPSTGIDELASRGFGIGRWRSLRHHLEAGTVLQGRELPSVMAAAS